MNLWGELGGRAAKKHLQSLGLKYLTANFHSVRGEIDLVFREDDCFACVIADFNPIPMQFHDLPPRHVIRLVLTPSDVRW